MFNENISSLKREKSDRKEKSDKTRTKRKEREREKKKKRGFKRGVKGQIDLLRNHSVAYSPAEFDWFDG